MPVVSEDLNELLGIEPEPESIEDWLGPAPMEDYAHQKREYDEHREDRARALWWTMRSGKTKAVIDKFSYQHSKGAIDGVVVIAPNGVHLNWHLNEIPKWSAGWPWLDPMKTFAWSTPRRGDWDQIAGLADITTPANGLRWFCINMEAIADESALAALRLFTKSCRVGFAVGISEVHHFGHAGSKRTSKARLLASKAKFVMVESGTPILNSPLRAYSIFKIIDEFGLRVGDGTYEGFVQYFADIVIDKQLSRSVRRRAIKKIANYKNLDELRDMMKPYSSVVLREDLKDMPALLQIPRYIVMSDKQRTAYMEMVSRHLVEIGDDYVSAKDAGARMMKLQQILNGYVMDTENGQIIDIDDDAPVYRAMVAEVQGTMPDKSIVWCRYHEDIRRCVAMLRKAKIDTLEFHGHIPTSQREPIRRDFQTRTTPVTLVGHPGAGGEGRDFSEARTIIFMASTPNAIHVEQGQERGTKVNGMPTTIVRFHTLGTVDDRNWQLADGKVDIAHQTSGRNLRDVLRATNI